MEKRGGGGGRGRGEGSSNSPLPPKKRPRVLSPPPVATVEDPVPPLGDRTSAREGGGREAAREQFENRERKWREDIRRLATRRGRWGWDPDRWWPTAEQWRLALHNARWKEEMDRRGVPYQTNHPGLDELRRWEEYFKSRGFNPEANQDFFDEEFDDDEDFDDSDDDDLGDLDS